MPRRAKVEKRIVLPDPRYNSRTLAKFINKMMLRGKKSTSERIVYIAMGLIETRMRRNPSSISSFPAAAVSATRTEQPKLDLATRFCFSLGRRISLAMPAMRILFIT